MAVLALVLLLGLGFLLLLGLCGGLPGSEELLLSPASGPRRAGGHDIVLVPACGGGGYASGVAAGNDFSPLGGTTQIPATSQPGGKMVCTVHLVESW